MSNSVKSSRMAPGDLDPTFGNNGLAHVMDPLGNALSVEGVAIDSDGVIFGYGSSYSTTQQTYLFKLLRDGELDQSFGSGGLCRLPMLPKDSTQPLPIVVDFPAIGMFISNGGIIVVGYAFVQQPDGLRFHVPAATRVRSDGTLDLAFGGGGDGVAIYNLPPGGLRPYEAGWPPVTNPNLAFHRLEGGAIFAADIWDLQPLFPPHRWYGAYLIKINDQGSLDPSFGEGGYVDLGRQQGIHAHGIEIDKENQILVSGFSGTQIGSVARFLPPGGKDGAFLGAILGGDQMVNCKQIKALDDGRYLGLAQLAPSIGTVRTESALLGFTYWGEPDPQFNGGVLVRSDLLPYVCTTLAIDAGNRALVAGQSKREALPDVFALTRLLPNGTIDEAFGDQGRVVLSDYSLCLAAQIQDGANIVFAAQGFEFERPTVIGRLIG